MNAVLFEPVVFHLLANNKHGTRFQSISVSKQLEWRSFPPLYNSYMGSLQNENLMKSLRTKSESFHPRLCHRTQLPYKLFVAALIYTA